MDNISLDKIIFNNNTSPYISDTNLNLMQNNIETAINALGSLVVSTLGLGGLIPQINGEDINDISTSGFVYLNNNCHYGEQILNNGYLLTLQLNTHYAFQIYTPFNDYNILQYRKKINDVWTNFKDIITENTDLIKVVTTSITIPIRNANGFGYVSKSVTIPNGYKSIATEFQTGAISLNSGLQLTAMNKASQLTGTADLYVQYFNPTAITEAQSITVYIICVKESMIS